jgi:single-strand DNA-binding protein
MADDAGQRAIHLDDSYFCRHWLFAVLDREKAGLIFFPHSITPPLIDYSRLQTVLSTYLPIFVFHFFEVWLINFSIFYLQDYSCFTSIFTSMNALKNKVQLIGHLGSKLDLKSLESGKSVGNVSLATSEVYKNQKGERVEETIWHNLVVWDKTAENLAKFTDKGSEIAVEGKLTNRSYTDKNGDKKTVTEIVVNEFLLLDKKPKGQ